MAQVAQGARELSDLIRRARLRLLRMHYEAGVGHIGGNLSALDTLQCLFHRVMGPQDQFILSKGHAAGALYVTLWSIGVLSDADLCRFHAEGTVLSGHPPVRGIEQIPFATGSLGHGLSLAAGLALGKQLKGEEGRVFCLTSDGEWNEGSTWEALIFARHHRLQRLVLIVDENGLQGFGTTREVADLSPLADKLRAFGAPTVEIDGHSPSAIAAALSETLDAGGASWPFRAVVCRTCKGCGVSFMKDRMEWHYLPMTQVQYRQACEEIEKSQDFERIEETQPPCDSST